MISVDSEAALAEAISDAQAPLRVLGGGTRPFGTPVAGEALSVSGLTGITLYEPGALTLVARAGTPLSEIEDALAAEGQRLAFEPMDHRPLLGTDGAPTLGGMVAVNASGPRRVQAGACRDFLLGVRFVDGTGAVVKNGGRVMKNVTGYDLVKLMAGSHGTLGVLTEVSLKVLPTAPYQAALRLPGLSVDRSVAAMTAALGTPYEVSGAARAPDGDTWLRLEGFEASVLYRAEALRDRLAAFGDVQIETEGLADLWRGLRDVAGIGGGDVWRLSAAPSDAPGLVARAEAEAVQLDWGGGLVWLALPEGTDLRARLGAFSGHATLIRASEATRASVPTFHPEPKVLARISAGLRARFDPKGILNPGVMG